ncbi:hypothetical protein EG68_07649 [Paragonimus skrjabini miyazakii]|uniref:Glutamyl-tRNA(Gln) amidotransferase subunit A, mitochondrial n=1 Tax=Paragonimus skrjabini miyazakii TaxID=59628 RepID=A0A8S9YQE1_9TREM|nr:hypothetical protein EG68_07649 [Paragonimus skrjabini miyazakii]
MIRGSINHLRSFFQTGDRDIRIRKALELFTSRIHADRLAYAAGSPVSELGLTPTNSFINVVPIDRALQNRSIFDEISPLAGIPMAIKDNFTTQGNKWGVPTTCASRMLEHFDPAYDAAVVTSLHDAGCILMGKTNMDEFAMGCGSTDSAISGPVINPWSCKQLADETGCGAAVIAGGSSGGSAAAVAAGLCLLAVASDTGGSARLPAAHCGVIGLKPTYGLISRHGLIPLVNSLDVPAVIASCVADVAAVLATWLNPSSGAARQLDATCSPLTNDQLDQFHSALTNIAHSTDVDKWSSGKFRIGIPVEYHAPGITDEVLQTWDRVAGWLVDGHLSCTVELIHLPHTPMATAVYSVLCAAEVASNMARYDGIRYGYRATHDKEQLTLDSTEALFAATRSVGFGEVVRSRILAGNFFLLRNQCDRHLDAARRLWRLIKQDFDEAFDQVDFLLTPVTLGPPPRLTDFVQLDNRTRTTLDDVCTVGVNLAGLPALTLPICLSPSTGLPLGLQLIGPAFSECKLLELAAHIEAWAEFPSLVDMRTVLADVLY